MQPAPPNRNDSLKGAWSLNELTHHQTEGVWLIRRLNLPKPIALVTNGYERPRARLARLLPREIATNGQLTFKRRRCVSDGVTSALHSRFLAK